RIEGLLFRPMAITIVFALIGCLLFALLAVPALAAILFPRPVREFPNPLLLVLRPMYRATLSGLIRFRWQFVPLALFVLAAAIAWVLPRLGSEFLPYMDEGTIWVKANFPEGTSLQQTALYADRIREIILTEKDDNGELRFGDIDFVSTQSGRADSNLDPFPPS